MDPRKFQAACYRVSSLIRLDANWHQYLKKAIDSGSFSTARVRTLLLDKFHGYMEMAIKDAILPTKKQRTEMKAALIKKFAKEASGEYPGVTMPKESATGLPVGELVAPC